MPDDERKRGIANTVASGAAPWRPRDTSVAVTLPAPPPSLDPDALAPAGTRIGRFVVLGPLGHGGMGVVVSAFDPDLDRKVAVKLVRSAKWAEFSSWGRDRLLREARAMARLQHPNVLTVHEVGTVGDQAFIAMEFAAGGTLRTWCATEVRPWREILAKLVAAGRGLVAAHQAGLVHRDFKPENVLLTEDGQVRVADFGLVGTGVDDAEAQGVLQPVSADDPLTKTGALVGTPAYMAPEQHDRQKAGPAADQFSFCVTAWEVLVRGHPYESGTYRELVENVRTANVTEPAAPGDVPSWVRAVLRRGMRPDPAERWPSMEDLLAALEHDPDAIRRRRLRTGALISAFGGLAAVAVVALTRSAPAEEPPCRGMERKLAGSWDDTTKAAVRAAFAATGRPYAEDTYRSVVRELDGYASSWVLARTDACEATRVRGEQSEALLDLRMGCLDRRLADVRALVGLLTAADVGMLNGAVQATANLAPLSSCADIAALQAVVPPPTDAATRKGVDALRTKLAQAKALEEAGKYREGLALATALEREARSLEYAATLAAALHRRGSLQERMADPAGAVASLEEALLHAAEAHDDELSAQIWADLVNAVDSQGRPAEALRLRPAAEASLRRIGGGPEVEARLRNALGSALASQARYEEAQQLHERALRLRERALGREHPLVAASLSNVGKVLDMQGKYDDARRYHERARELWEKALGPGHPDVATSLYDLGLVLAAQGKYDEARQYQERAMAIRQNALGPEHASIASSLSALGELFSGQGAFDEARRHHERALAIRQKALGPDHVAVAGSWNNLGNAFDALGDSDEARRHYERALAVWEKALGPDHPDVAAALTNLGNVADTQGRYDDARRFYERAIAIREKALGSGHPGLAGPRSNLGNVLHELGLHDEARQQHERALAIWERALGADHPVVAYAVSGLALDLVALGRADDARASAERGVRIREADPGPPEELAWSRFALASALWAQGRERPRAVALARQARDVFVAGGKATRKQRDEVDAWFRARGIR